MARRLVATKREQPNQLAYCDQRTPPYRFQISSFVAMHHVRGPSAKQRRMLAFINVRTALGHPQSRSRLRSDAQVVIVAGGGDAVAALVWSEAGEGVPDGVPEIGHGAGGYGP